METRHKILLLDDDPDLLDLYREILTQLPSRPDIRTSASGARAIAMLEAEPYRLFICDLKMPKMDGLQVLSIVRRKHPELRTVVLTSVVDEQFRSRVYALGVDLFWQKPASEKETHMFMECIESLLGRDSEPGFRGLQSKSLMDIIQLECISQSSSVLRITNGPLSGRIWITAGELVDAETDGATGEDAFQKILSWKTGSFEALPAEPDRPRTIHTSYNALLLDTAQAIDEQRNIGGMEVVQPGATSNAPPSALTPLAQVEGVEFVLVAKPPPRKPGKKAKPAKPGDKLAIESRGLENPERLAVWARQTLEHFDTLGQRLQAGPLEQINGLGLQRNVGLARKDEAVICTGWQHAVPADEINERMKKVVAIWGS